MSHFTDITLEMKDERSLKAACAELGLAVESNAIARDYSGRTKSGDLVIRCPGEYDIAVNRAADGKFALTTDWYRGTVEQAVGKNYARLVQLYGVHKATIAAKQRGLQVKRIAKQDGGIRLAITGRAL